MSQNVYVAVNNEPAKVKSEPLEPQIGVVRELDILNRRFKEKLITTEEFQEKVK